MKVLQAFWDSPASILRQRKQRKTLTCDNGPQSCLLAHATHLTCIVWIDITIFIARAINHTDIRLKQDKEGTAWFCSLGLSIFKCVCCDADTSSWQVFKNNMFSMLDHASYVIQRPTAKVPQKEKIMIRENKQQAETAIGRFNFFDWQSTAQAFNCSYSKWKWQ